MLEVFYGRAGSSQEQCASRCFQAGVDAGTAWPSLHRRGRRAWFTEVQIRQGQKARGSVDAAGRYSPVNTMPCISLSDGELPKETQLCDNTYPGLVLLSPKGCSFRDERLEPQGQMYTATDSFGRMRAGDERTHRGGGPVSTQPQKFSETTTSPSFFQHGLLPAFFRAFGDSSQAMPSRGCS